MFLPHFLPVAASAAAHINLIVAEIFDRLDVYIYIYIYVHMSGYVQICCNEASKAAAAAPFASGRLVAKKKVIAVAKLKARPARAEAHAHT